VCGGAAGGPRAESNSDAGTRLLATDAGGYMTAPMRIGVLGGGLSGLSVAWYLRFVCGRAARVARHATPS
jgi:hypothetical protein